MYADPLCTRHRLMTCPFEHFLRLLDLDDSAEADEVVMTAVKHMHSLPLPLGWSTEMDDESSFAFFYDSNTGESKWFHPQERLFKELIAEVKSWPNEEATQVLVCKVQANLEQAHRDAANAISEWARVPYDESQGQTEYFVNRITGASDWIDPREALDFALRQRLSVLCTCLQVHDEKLQANQHGSMRSLPTPSRRRLPLPVRDEVAVVSGSAGADDAESLSSRLASRFAPGLRLQPVKSASRPASSSRSRGSCTVGDTGRSSMYSEASTCSSSSSCSRRRSSRGVPSIVLNGLELDRAPQAAPSLLRRPPTTPCRWLAHARFVNSQLRSENDEIQLLLLQLRRSTKKMQRIQDGNKDGAAVKALKAEHVALKHRARYCLTRSVGVLKHPKADPSQVPLPPPTPLPARMLTPTSDCSL
eukprot:gb/GFBE01064379.1/.p1 GENE.gb/GFBE01064379.1/~~gb/GFBE01064379.1/.p1  ORF type:complete len:418 (+),score=61.12 gb/GFBE01064379.1/:1-1254(+)